MKRSICFLLILVMATALLAGCGEKKKLMGTWECTVDASHLAKELLDAQEIGEDFEIPGFSVTARLTFLKDNTFRLELEKKKLEAAVAALEECLAKGLVDALQAKLTEQGVQIDIEELLQHSGLEQDALTQKLTEAFDENAFLDALSERLTVDGYYRVKGEKLLFCQDAETKLKDVYTAYILEENVLTFQETVGENSFISDNLFFGTTPMKFTKVG